MIKTELCESLPHTTGDGENMPSTSLLVAEFPGPFSEDLNRQDVIAAFERLEPDERDRVIIEEILTAEDPVHFKTVADRFDVTTGRVYRQWKEIVAQALHPSSGVTRELGTAPDWQKDAECASELADNNQSGESNSDRNYFTDAFHQKRNVLGPLCGSCAVSASCLTYAEEFEITIGTWGGRHETDTIGGSTDIDKTRDRRRYGVIAQREKVKNTLGDLSKAHFDDQELSSRFPYLDSEELTILQRSILTNDPETKAALAESLGKPASSVKQKADVVVSKLAHPSSGASTLAENRLTWHEQAACNTSEQEADEQSEDPIHFIIDDFFRERGVTKSTIETCKGCPVIKDCQSFAIQHQTKGYWGGMSEKERKSILRQVNEKNEQINDILTENEAIDYELDESSLSPASLNPLHHDILPNQDVRELIRLFNVGRGAENALLDPAHIPEGVRAQLERIAERGEIAKDAVWTHNQKLVAKNARQFAAKFDGLDYEDYFSAGQTGLHRAIELFDVDNGASFSNYATWWIKQSMGLAIRNEGRNIRLPGNVHTKLGRLSTYTQHLEEDLGASPTTEELANEMDMDSKQVEELQALNERSESLNSTVGGYLGEIRELGDTIEDYTFENPEEHAIMESTSRMLEDAIGNLSDLERKVIELFYFHDGKSSTEVADELDITTERAEELRDSAIHSLEQNEKLAGIN